MNSYSEMLKDPRWQRRRLEILQRSDFTCEWCDAKDKTLHVHHTTYIKGHKPWDYGDDLLLSLCEDCHKEWHWMKGRLDRAIAHGSYDDIERILDFALLLEEGRDVDVIVAPNTP